VSSFNHHIAQQLWGAWQAHRARTLPLGQGEGPSPRHTPNQARVRVAYRFVGVLPRFWLPYTRNTVPESPSPHDAWGSPHAGFNCPWGSTLPSIPSG
jgi:hypothetical protein